MSQVEAYGEQPKDNGNEGEEYAAAMRAAPLEAVVNAPPRRRTRSGERQLVRFGQG